MWSEEKAASLHAYLVTESGRDFIEFVKEGAPEFSMDGMEKAALSAQRVYGFDLALKRVQEAIDFKDDKPVNSGPAWIDTSKLDVKEL